jgi:hypothetical protein
MVSMELLAVGLFTLLAGISDKVGKAMVIVMVGFWMLFMIIEWRAPRALANSILSFVFNPYNSIGVAGNPANSPAGHWDFQNPTGLGPVP